MTEGLTDAGRSDHAIETALVARPRQSVHTLYGYTIETNGDYFEKLIDFTIKFPQLDAINNYEMLLKEQLFRIGEIENKEHFSTFYFWVLALQL